MGLFHTLVDLTEIESSGNNSKPKFTHFTKNGHVEEGTKDIENDMFWKAIYCLLHSVFPALKVLCNCDYNVLLMDKIFFCCKKLMMHY